MKSSPHRRFVRLFLIVFSLPAILIALFNWIVDPFDYYQSPKLEKTNAVKVSLEKQQRLHKSVEIARQKPDVILLGSSRVMAGIDPDYLSQLVEGQKAYNAGFAGASMEEIYHYFEHALHHQPHLKVVVLGLDFFAFGKNKRPKNDFSLARLQNGTFELKNSLSILWSQTALKSGYETLMANYFEQPQPYFFSNGLHNPAVIPSPSQADLVLKGDLAFIELMFGTQDFYYGYRLGQDKITWFKKLVERCQEKGITLKVFFCPAKVIYWESLYRKGLWPIFEDLKQELSQVYPIWDFSGFNCITTQALEKEGSPLYYECSHFRPAVGKMIVEKIFGKSEEPADFGYFLTRDTIKEALSNMRQDRLRWLQTQPPLINALQAALPLES